MTDFNLMWLAIGGAAGIAAGMVAMVALFALGSAGRGRTEQRATEQRALAAWRGMMPILPGWKPTLEQLDALDCEHPRVIAAYRSIAEGWASDDARWDVLVAVLVYTRREALRLRVEQLRAIAADGPRVKMG